MIDLGPILEAPLSPLAVVQALGLKAARGSSAFKAIVSCPVHAEKTPSCVVARRDGRIVFRCHGCGEGGDLLGLVAAVHRLDVARDFRDVAELAADLVGVRLTDDTRPAADRHTRPRSVRRLEPAERVEPPRAGLSLEGELGTILRPVCDVAPVAAYLEGRGLLALAAADGWLALDAAELRHAIEERVGLGGDPTEGSIGLAGFVRRGDDGFRVAWPGHSLVIPWRDLRGGLDTIQRRAIDRRDPKYIFPPARSPAWPCGIERLARAKSGAEIVLVEGAIDAVARRALDDADRVVLGLPGAQGWRAEWAVFAAGRTVRLALDADAAGDRASERIAAELWEAGAVRIMRERSEGKDWAERLRGAA